VVCLIVQGLVPFNYPSLCLESFAASCRICAYARRRFRLPLVAAVLGANRTPHVGTKEAMSPMRTMGVNGRGFSIVICYFGLKRWASC
jgi:hypothetical protein